MTALKEIYKPIQKNLSYVEEELRMTLNHKIKILTTGKRLRPALLLFSAHAFDGSGDQDIARTASAIEMIHTASLIHDDIIDKSVQRRNKPSLYRSLGVKPAVIFADLLFIQGLAKLELVRPVHVLPLVVRAVNTMCEGQWIELSVAAQKNFTEQNYLSIIEKKTASLFACCCQVGGLFRHADKKEMEYLSEFGRNFGLAYQLLDDAADLSENQPTPSEQKLLEWGGENYCEQVARDFSERARSQVSHLTDEVEKNGLGQILSYMWR